MIGDTKVEYALAKEMTIDEQENLDFDLHGCDFMLTSVSLFPPAAQMHPLARSEPHRHDAT